MEALPAGFIYVSNFIDGLDEAIPYATNDNFLGQRVDGYLASRAILTQQAAESLAQVQRAAITQGFRLKIFDAYRPARAVKHFLRWIDDVESPECKQRFHPEFSKAELFEQGYLATHSSHCRGSTVDLTLVSYQTGEELDMGTEFDFFGKESWSSYQNLSLEQLSNRQLLQDLMLANDFQPFELEWWHYMLVNEPFPDTSFDFLVE